jgi:predicted DNA-binding transcriptional regulator AlpA
MRPEITGQKPHTAVAVPKWVPCSTLELLSRREVQAMFGGIHAATLYRHIRNQVIPAPVKVGALSRWLRSECEQALTAMVAGRVR